MTNMCKQLTKYIRLMIAGLKWCLILRSCQLVWYQLWWYHKKIQIFNEWKNHNKHGNNAPGNSSVIKYNHKKNFMGKSLITFITKSITSNGIFNIQGYIYIYIYIAIGNRFFRIRYLYTNSKSQKRTIGIILLGHPVLGFVALMILYICV